MSSAATRAQRGRLVAVVGILAIGGAAAAGYVALRLGLGPLPDPERCSATVGELSVALTTGQAENASVISAVAARRGLPARAVTIAIATAYQESDLENLAEGDRDSLGLFQQRPSQGWGTQKQVMDPYYASNAFYDALVQVEGYEDMEITAAAQEVQRSAFPEAYADHEADGRAIASAMTGNSGAAFTCVVDDAEAGDDRVTENGLTRSANAVRADLAEAFGELSLGGFEPGGVNAGHIEGSAHYDGRAIDIFFRPVSDDSQRRGWVVAHYLVANAARLDIAHVIFDGRIWGAGSRSKEGWRDFDPTNAEGVDPATLAILEHRDHVHVDVA